MKNFEIKKGLKSSAGACLLAMCLGMLPAPLPVFAAVKTAADQQTSKMKTVAFNPAPVPKKASASPALTKAAPAKTATAKVSTPAAPAKASTATAKTGSGSKAPAAFVMPTPPPATTNQLVMPQIPMADAATIAALRAQANSIMNLAGTTSGNFMNQATSTRLSMKASQIKIAANEIVNGTAPFLLMLPGTPYTNAMWANHNPESKADITVQETMKFFGFIMRIQTLYRDAQRIDDELSGGSVPVTRATELQNQLNVISAEVNDLANNKIPTSYNTATAAYALAKQKIGNFISDPNAGGYISSAAFWLLLQTSSNPNYMHTHTSFTRLRSYYNQLP